ARPRRSGGRSASRRPGRSGSPRRPRRSPTRPALASRTRRGNGRRRARLISARVARCGALGSKTAGGRCRASPAVGDLCPLWAVGRNLRFLLFRSAGRLPYLPALSQTRSAMCGIVGYIGSREAGDLLVTGLKRLEYRGYDSAGVAVLNGAVEVRKKEGKVDELVALLGTNPVKGTVGVGHTRWATHGAPSDTNAHPHASSDGAFALVHNGIIENYGAIRERLKRKGYAFESETDTEALVHLIEDVRKETGLPLVEAVRQALTQ